MISRDCVAVATEGGSQCAAVAALSLSRRRATDLLLLPPTCATLPSKLILLRIVSNTNEQHSMFQNAPFLSSPPDPSRSESAIALFPNQKGTRRGPNFEKDGDLDNVKRGPKFEFFQIVHTEKSSRNQISNTEKHWGTVGMGLWEQYQRGASGRIKDKSSLCRYNYKYGCIFLERVTPLPPPQCHLIELCPPFPSLPL